MNSLNFIFSELISHYKTSWQDIKYKFDVSNITYQTKRLTDTKYRPISEEKIKCFPYTIISH